MRVLVTGAGGLLGRRLVPDLQSSGRIVVSHSHRTDADLRGDLTEPDAAVAAIAAASPDAIVHLVSLTDVDLCERDPDRAYRVNVRTVENIVDALASVLRRPHLILISTDQVYDGPGQNREEDIALRNTYALTKVWAERIARELDATVLRTNFFGRSHTAGRLSFSDWILREARARGSMRLLTDVYFSPLSVETVCRVISRVLERPRPGIFNVGSKDGMSKRDFAHQVAQRMGITLENAHDATQADLQLDALRPTGMMMDSRRFEDVFDFPLPTLQREISIAEL